MPNWCDTSIVFFTKEDSKKADDQLVRLHHVIDKCHDEERIENGFGTNWLGNVVDFFGFDWNDIRCRSSYEDAEPIDRDSNGSFFNLYQCDAWGPQCDPWGMILETYFPLVDMVYLAEEPGCEVYINTDKSGRFFPDRYVLSGEFHDDYIHDYFISWEALLSYLKDLNLQYPGGLGVGDGLNIWFNENDIDLQVYEL